MNGTRCIRVSLVLAALFAGLMILGAAQVTLGVFEQALQSIPVSDTARHLAALELGMGQADFPSSEALQLIERLAAASGTAAEKEALLLHVTVASEEGLPIEGLLTKGLEGLARGVPVSLIERSIHQRAILLAETRDLLYAMGIFSVAPGSPQSVPTAIPTPRFNLLVTHISDTIADYLEGGRSPFEGQTLYQEVRFRLNSLEGVILNPADVELVLKRVEPADLTRVALSAVT